MDLFKVWVPPREHLSVQAIFGAACFVLENLERQNSTHLAFFKHQNTKTSLCRLPKNHWIFTLLEILGSVRRKLQSTVSLDHPVAPLVYKRDERSDIRAVVAIKTVRHDPPRYGNI